MQELRNQERGDNSRTLGSWDIDPRFWSKSDDHFTAENSLAALLKSKLTLREAYRRASKDFYWRALDPYSLNPFWAFLHWLFPRWQYLANFFKQAESQLAALSPIFQMRLDWDRGRVARLVDSEANFAQVIWQLQDRYLSDSKFTPAVSLQIKTEFYELLADLAVTDPLVAKNLLQSLADDQSQSNSEYFKRYLLTQLAAKPALRSELAKLDPRVAALLTVPDLLAIKQRHPENFDWLMRQYPLLQEKLGEWLSKTLPTSPEDLQGFSVLFRLKPAILYTILSRLTVAQLNQLAHFSSGNRRGLSSVGDIFSLASAEPFVVHPLLNILVNLTLTVEQESEFIIRCLRSQYRPLAQLVREALCQKLIARSRAAHELLASCWLHPDCDTAILEFMAFKDGHIDSEVARIITDNRFVEENLALTVAGSFSDKAQSLWSKLSPSPAFDNFIEELSGHEKAFIIAYSEFDTLMTHRSDPKPALNLGEQLTPGKLSFFETSPVIEPAHVIKSRGGSPGVPALVDNH